VRYGGELDGAYRRHQHTDEQACRHRFNSHFRDWKQPRGAHLRRCRREVQRQGEGSDGCRSGLASVSGREIRRRGRFAARSVDEHHPPQPPPLHGAYDKYLISYDKYLDKYAVYRTAVDQYTVKAYDSRTAVNTAKSRTFAEALKETSEVNVDANVSPSESVSQVSAGCNKATFQKAKHPPRGKCTVFVKPKGSDTAFVDAEKVFPGVHVPLPAETHNYVPRNAAEAAAKAAAKAAQSQYDWQVVVRRNTPPPSKASKGKKTGKTSSKVSSASSKKSVKQQRDDAYSSGAASLQQSTESSVGVPPFTESAPQKDREVLSMIDRLKGGSQNLGSFVRPTSY